MALRLPRPDETDMGHKWDDGAFVDIRRKIKQEPNIGGSSGNAAANNNNGEGNLKAIDSDEEDSDGTDQMDVVSITDESDGAPFHYVFFALRRYNVFFFVVCFFIWRRVLTYER